jgi:hypothetical protein
MQPQPSLHHQQDDDDMSQNFFHGSAYMVAPITQTTPYIHGDDFIPSQSLDPDWIETDEQGYDACSQYDSSDEDTQSCMVQSSNHMHSTVAPITQTTPYIHGDDFIPSQSLDPDWIETEEQGYDTCSQYDSSDEDTLSCMVQSSNYMNSTVAPIAATRVLVENVLILNTLLDTGSSVNVISTDFFNQICDQSRISHAERANFFIPPPLDKLIVVGKGIQTVHNGVALSVQFPHGAEEIIDFCLLENHTSLFLLGMPALRTLNVTMSTLQRPNVNLIEHVSTDANLARLPDEKHSSPSSKQPEIAKCCSLLVSNRPKIVNDHTQRSDYYLNTYKLYDSPTIPRYTTIKTPKKTRQRVKGDRKSYTGDNLLACKRGFDCTSRSLQYSLTRSDTSIVGVTKSATADIEPLCHVLSIAEKQYLSEHVMPSIMKHRSARLYPYA